MESKLPARQILIVEDNHLDALVLKRALTEHDVDYHAVVITDGDEAIEYLLVCPPERKPDLIVIDLNLPRQDGIEVLKRYRMSPSFVETRIVVLTSSDSASDRHRADTIGVDAYLRKPMFLEDFIKLGGILRRLLESSPASVAN